MNDAPLATESELARANEILVSIESMRDQIALIATLITKDPTIVAESDRVVMIDFCAKLSAGLDAVRPELDRLMKALSTASSSLGLTNAITSPSVNPVGGRVEYMKDGVLRVRYPDGRDEARQIQQHRHRASTTVWYWIPIRLGADSVES